MANEQRTNEGFQKIGKFLLLSPDSIPEGTTLECVVWDKTHKENKLKERYKTGDHRDCPHCSMPTEVFTVFPFTLRGVTKGYFLPECECEKQLEKSLSLAQRLQDERESMERDIHYRVIEARNKSKKEKYDKDIQREVQKRINQ